MSPQVHPVLTQNCSWSWQKLWLFFAPRRTQRTHPLARATSCPEHLQLQRSEKFIGSLSWGKASSDSQMVNRNQKITRQETGAMCCVCHMSFEVVFEQCSICSILFLSLFIFVKASTRESSTLFTTTSGTSGFNMFKSIPYTSQWRSLSVRVAKTKRVSNHQAVSGSNSPPRILIGKGVRRFLSISVAWNVSGGAPGIYPAWVLWFVLKCSVASYGNVRGVQIKSRSWLNKSNEFMIKV